MQKYGAFDYRGGGRASARETACRVAAGAIAKKILALEGIVIEAWLAQVGDVLVEREGPIVGYEDLFCPNVKARKVIQEKIESLKVEGDSIGGVVQFSAKGVPVGLGEPVYEKLEANLAKGMMSLPASKAFEIGSGVSSAAMLGSEHNDSFYSRRGSN